jgi:hypothetical protein
MIEKISHFGEDFEFNQENRLDILRNKEKLPEYLKMGLTVREGLKEKVRQEGYPECPKDFSSLQDFFDKANRAVNEKWEIVFLETINFKKEEWLNEIPSTPDNQEMIRLLENPEILRTQIEMQQFGALENIRKIIPEAWKTLITFASERQLAKLTLTRHWSKELNSENFQKLGINKEELNLFLDAASIMGKYFDQAYIKQIELADLPTGSLKTSLGGKQGAKFIYDLEDSEGTTNLKTYADVFPFEWPMIVKRFRDLANKTESLVQEGKIFDSYQGLADYLRKLSEMYGSSETDLEKLPKQWEELNKMAVNLAQDGCPIMLVPEATPSVAGEANKVDVELRFGLQTNETQKLKRYFKIASNTAQNFNVQYQEALADKSRQIPEIVPNIQPFAFGPNLYWMTRGQSEPGFIFLHQGPITEIASQREKPILDRTIEGFSLDEISYGKAAILETGLHEIAHAVTPKEDDNVDKRLGNSPEAAMLEELKAETVGIKILKETLDKSDPNYLETVKNQFFAKIGTLCDYLLNKSSEIGSSGERYYYAAITIFDLLLENEVLKEKDEKYEVIDAEKGLELIANLGKNVIESFYANLKITPEEVKSYGSELRSKREKESIQRFLKNLKEK